MRPANVIGVAGAGAWGMALGNAAAAAGRAVILWGRDEDRMRAMATTRRSDRLPGVDIARAVEATKSLDRKTVAEAIRGKTIKGTVFGDAAFLPNGQLQPRYVVFKVPGRKD